MRISDWHSGHELFDWDGGAVSSVIVETAPDGLPLNCLISVEKHDSHGDDVTRVLVFSAGEMMQIALGEWHQKTREYSNKVIAENRKEAGIE